MVVLYVVYIIKINTGSIIDSHNCVGSHSSEKVYLFCSHILELTVGVIVLAAELCGWQYHICTMYMYKNDTKHTFHWKIQLLCLIAKV